MAGSHDFKPDLALPDPIGSSISDFLETLAARIDDFIQTHGLSGPLWSAISDFLDRLEARISDFIEAHGHSAADGAKFLDAHLPPSPVLPDLPAHASDLISEFVHQITGTDPAD